MFVVSFLDLLFVGCSCCFGHCFDFGLGVVFSVTLLFFPFLMLFCLCNTPVVFVVVLIFVMFFVECSCSFVDCSDFCVAFFVMLFQFWCSCSQYLIPDLVVVSILVFFNALDVLVIVCEMLFLIQSLWQYWCCCLFYTTGGCCH